MDKKQLTINAYRKNATSLAEKFDKLPTRVNDIDELFTLLPQPDPVVLEIGCANGRDAQEMVKRTVNYLGLDAAEELIALAKRRLPQAHFVVADVEEYAFPPGLDAIVAFASLIHTDKTALKTVFDRMHAALKPGGLVRLSLKKSPDYAETTKDSEYGIRTYYLYSEKDIAELAVGFDFMKNETVTVRGQDWLEIILRKR